ncbi:MAG TPA: putative Ig domain-containing protein [Candidatus Synoicihabitans sp.]|nr:putative Ig domain-containing protein [Candidatus Synoicihabitans sp.]
MPVPNQPSHTDGKAGLSTVLLEILNLPGDGTDYLRLAYISDNVQAEGVEQDFTNTDGESLGGSTFTGPEKGAIAYKLNKVTDAEPGPGYVLRLNRGDGKGDKFYRAGAPGPAFAKGTQTTGSVSVSRLMNPVIVTLLSAEYGQHKAVTVAAAAGAYELECAALNVRAGATTTWSLAGEPTGMVIDPSTGELTWATPVAGSYEIEVTAADALAGKVTREGWGKLLLTVT